MRKRSSSISSMKYGRRNSTVKSVAFNVPLMENNDNLEDIINKMVSHKREDETAELKRHSRFDLNCYPFDNNEQEFLWSQFFDQFEVDNMISFEDDTKLQDSISNESIYNFKTQIHHVLDQHQVFLNDTNKIQSTLTQLAQKNEQVSAQTQEFQNKSNQLIEQIENYNTLSVDLNNNLKIFLALDDIVRYLNSNHTIIFEPAFKDTLNKLDKSLEFVFDPAQKNYKEIELYQIKFKQCMVRALTMIRNHVTASFKEITNELNNSHLSSITLTALIYNKFENDCIKFKTLLNEIYTRAGSDPEYMGLMTDCYNSYFKTRKPFLSNMIHAHISNYNGAGKPLVQYAQDQIQFFTKVSKDEYNLFKAIFYIEQQQQEAQQELTESDDKNHLNFDKIHGWLMELLNPLYQLCKNRILRELNIDRLCELIILLQKYYDYEEDEYNNPANDISFDKLFEPILQDVQQKLVIRINVYIDRNIINYKATGTELTIGHRRQKNSILMRSNSEVMDDSGSNNDDTQSMISTAAGSIIDDDDGNFTDDLQNYYPPIVKSIKLLNKIYLLVNSEIFSGLANSIIHLLILSIKENFEQNNIKDYSNLNDLKLYLIKNFIYLTRTIENNFDIEYVGNETNLDFTGLQSLLFGFITKKETAATARQQTSFFQRIVDSVPKYVNNVIDGKYELQLELRNIIHLYIDESATNILAPIADINETLPAEEITSKMNAFKNSIGDTLNKHQSQIEYFINDDLDIVYSLVNGIKENIISKYDLWYDDLKDKIDNQELLMDSDTLFFYLNKQ